MESIVNGRKVVGSQRGDVCATLAGQSTFDSLDTVDVDRARDAIGDLEVTVEILTGGVLVEVALVLNGDLVTAAAVYIPS